MRAAKTCSIVVCCVLLFSIFEASVCAPRQTPKFIGESHPYSYLSFCICSTNNAKDCGNILPCLASLDHRGDRTKQLLHWLKLLHTSYISLLNQDMKGRIFYSVDKCFETGADPRNIFDKQILKNWTPCLSASYRVISQSPTRRTISKFDDFF